MMFITSWSSLIFVGFLFTAKASKDCTPKPTDLVFVLDESGSVGDINFQLQNQFVAKLVEGFDIGINNTQVAVITFSSEVVVEFYLHAIHDKQQLLESIKHINYSHSGLTMTHRALNAVRNDVFTVANGMRPNALHFVIVLTDGRSMSSRATLNEAKLLSDMNITVFAIGISNEVNEVELRGLASDPKDVIIVKDFDSLMSIRNQALNGACEALKKRDKDYNSMKVTTDTVFEISTGSLTTATMTTEAPTIGSTKPTTTSFEEKYPSSNLIDSITGTPSIQPQMLSRQASTKKAPTTDSSTSPPSAIFPAYSSTDYGYWTDCTPKPTDLVFVLDESGSVGDINFQLQNQFVAKLVEGFDIGINNTQVAVITFSSEVVVEFYLHAIHDKQQLLESIKHINYSHSGLTMTHRALNAVRNDVFTVANGMRPNALHFVIVLTDGRSMSSRATLNEAKLLSDMNITVFAIGISNEVNEVELRGLASDPKDVIIVKDFDSLMSIRNQALNGACEALKKRDKDYNSMKVTTDTVFEISTGSLTTATMTTEAPTIGSTKPTTTSFEEKYPSSNLIDSITGTPSIQPQMLSRQASTKKAPTTDSSTSPPSAIFPAYSSTDYGYWTESSSLPPNIVFHTRKPSTQLYRTSRQTTQTTTRTTISDPTTMHPVAIPTYSSTDNVYWTDSSSTYPSNFAIFGQGTSTFTSDKSIKTSTRITNAFNAILSKATPIRTSKSHTTKKIVTTNPVPRITNTRTTTPSGERTSVLNNKLSHPHSRFSIPGYFQFIEVGLIAITTIVDMGLLGCCCLRFCGGKRSEDDDEDEKKETEAKSIQPAWKENHRNPVSKPNRWTDDF